MASNYNLIAVSTVYMVSVPSVRVRAPVPHRLLVKSAFLTGSLPITVLLNDPVIPCFLSLVSLCSEDQSVL